MQTIKPSQKNTNKHTQEGTALLKKSINDFGVLESIATATDGTIITGHARFEQFKENGLKPKFIKLEKNEFAVLETDIENNTKQYYEAQIMANTTANKNFDLDIEMIEVIAQEFDIDIEEVGVELTLDEQVDKSEQGESIYIPKSLQVIPKKEYILIMADEDSEDWQELQQIFKCGLVRQGGCKIGSTSDKVGRGIERVFDLKTFKERVLNEL
jgi:hypothetical protein